MSINPKVLAFSGSIRKESFNKKLIKLAAASTQKAGADVALIDLKDFPLPIYDGDLEAEKGIPENAKKLQDLFVGHQGLLLACPEYNSSITPLLKNTLDWVSRPIPNQPSLASFQNKVVGLLSASPGALGGLRGLVHMRSILENIGCIVLPHQMAISKAHEAFNLDGSFKDEKQLKLVEKVGADLVKILSQLSH